jgi:UrcA family protein
MTMFVKGFTRIGILTLAACGATVLNPAAAAVAGDVPSANVRYGDLDLNTMKGVAALYRRLRLAADGVCSSLNSRDVLQKQRFDQCRSTALANGVAKVNNPSLTEYYAKMTHSAAEPVAIAKN